MRRRKSLIHWLAPTSMLAALFTGVLFATGHHLFYQSLNGARAPTGSYHVLGLNLSEQQLHNTAGTAFAFLIKACLTISVTIAFVQVFWRALIVKSAPGGGVVLARIDATFSAITNLWSLLNPFVWWREPLLWLLALVAWLIPVATVVPPGTLFVERAEQTNSSLLAMPYLNFTSMNFNAHMQADADWTHSATYVYDGPNQAVIRAIGSTLRASGSILPISPPFTNSSWEINFHGPSLKCSNLESTRIELLKENLKSAQCYAGSAFTAWFGDLPFTLEGTPEGILKWNPKNQLVSSEPTGRNASISLAILPEILKHNILLDPTNIFNQPVGANRTCQWPVVGPSELFRGATWLECQLFNTSYNVNFDYTNGRQDITINAPHRQSDQMVVTAYRVNGPLSQTGPELHLKVQEPCIMRTPVEVFESTASPGHCAFNADVLQTLAYQGIMVAFTNYIVGTLNQELGLQSQIASTPLVNTKELTPLLNFFTLGKEGGYLDSGRISGILLQDALAGTDAVNISGASKPSLPVPSRSISSAIEELFQNATVSLLSEAYLQYETRSLLHKQSLTENSPNMSLEEMPRTNVTFITFANVYVYSASKLWIAYGIAILSTMITALAGLIAMISCGASFSNNFSSVMRSAWAAELSVDVRPEDANSQDPLPKYLAKATFKLPNK